MDATSQIPRVTNINRYRAFSAGCAYECTILVAKELEGYSAHVAMLPGVVGEGDTVNAAVSDVESALRDALAEYRLSGDIPWSKNEVEGDIVATKRILV